jgi:hypothetical protein
VDAIGLDWDDYLSHLIERWGSLSAVAEQVAIRRQLAEQIDSIERGLRRLRGRGHRGGGVWGQRLLSLFGLPDAVSDRIRWMGQYHTRFTDLPASLCAELIAPWDRPPVTEGPARIWIHLGHASLALRRWDRDEARAQLRQADRVAPRAEVAARIELLLVRSFLTTFRDLGRSVAMLDEAAPLLDDPSLSTDDRTCLRARLVDQQAYRLNKGLGGLPPEPAAAEVLYASLPEEGPPFALCRRANGLGWSRLLQGDVAGALAHGQASVEHAGDGGSLRLRAMALNLVAAAAEGTEQGVAARSRAVAIARRLEDEALRLRLERAQAERRVSSRASSSRR